MSCPYFEDAYVGVCNASDFPYVPSIAEMEQYCFKENHWFCPTFEAGVLKKEVRTRHDRKRLSSIFLRPVSTVQDI